MNENMNFETVRQNIIETFEEFKRRNSFFDDAEKALDMQNILRNGEHLFSKIQLIELSCLINTLLFNYLCYVTLNRFNQLEKIMAE